MPFQMLYNQKVKYIDVHVCLYNTYVSMSRIA